MESATAEGREITGVACIVAGDLTFEGIRYRIRVVETGGKKRLTGGIIDAQPEVLSAIQERGEAAIELGTVLGWFWFTVTDVHCGSIKLTRWINRA